MKIDFARELAIKILYKINTGDGYSNLILDEYLNNYRQKLNTKDINLISEIVYGTVSNKLAIETIIQKYSKIKLNKISKWVLEILRIGTYQILFLDKVPKSAAVNESVNLCKKYGNKSASFVNAILRKIEKSDYEEFKNIEDNVERISKIYSMPKWIVEEFMKEYDEEIVENMCRYSNSKPKLTVRVNTIKTTQEEFIKRLEENDIKFEKSAISNFIYLEKVKNISELPIFKDGLCTVQDEGAGQISIMLFPKENEKVLDACSAPGGKTTHLAELMSNKGEITACDIYEHRIKLVEENANRLGAKIIKTKILDAQEYNKEFEQKFDKILLDVPCLGLGVIKRKPDIKWQRKKEDLEQIHKVQYNILKQSINYLKNNGELVYSTCSIIKNENEEIIQEVIKKWNSENLKNKVEIVETKKILPNKNTDGFFMCKIVLKAQ